MSEDELYPAVFNAILGIIEQHQSLSDDEVLDLTRRMTDAALAELP